MLEINFKGMSGNLGKGRDLVTYLMYSDLDLDSWPLSLPGLNKDTDFQNDQEQ